MSLLGLIQTRGRKVKVKRPHYRDDTMGSRVMTFVQRPDMDAYVAFRGSNETYEGDRKVVQETMTFYVRGGSDLKVTDRIVLDNMTYEVTGLRTPGARQQGDRHFYHVVDAVSNESV